MEPFNSVYSKVLNEKRKIWVYVPNSTDNATSQYYPVVYLLDGDLHFYSVMGMIHQLSEINGNTICPQMILVGIPNIDRTRDLSPTHVSTGSFLDSISLKTSGGGENLTTSLEKELIPHIDSLYPTRPYRMLIGHSLGGLMVINTLINHTNLFNSYVAIDPSLWWDNLVSGSALSDSLDMMKKVIALAEANALYRINTLGEPQLRNRRLYPTTSTKKSIEVIRDQRNFIAYADGKNDLLEIRRITGLLYNEVMDFADLMFKI